MKTATFLIILMCFIGGAAVGAYYMNRQTEERYAYHQVEQLYKESAQEMKTYSKLLRLTRNEEKERVIRYLEALLGSASTTLEVTQNDVPQELRLTIGKEAIDYMAEYRKEFPVEADNAP